jgi:hypothetical protein
MGGKTASTTTQITQQQRPGYVDSGYQNYYLPGVLAAYNRPYQAYQGQRVADLNPDIQSGMTLARQRAISGSPAINAATQNVTDTLNGRYLDPTTNPAWAPMAAGITDAYGHGVAAQTDSTFARNRAFGGSAYNEATQRNQSALGSALAGAAGNLYNQERGNQFQAAQLAPQLGQADYQDAEALFGIGDTQRGYNQDLLNQNLSDYTAQTNYPLSQIDLLGRGLGNAMTGSQSQLSSGANPYRPSATAGALGGALAGAGAGTGSGAPGWGTLIGALLGAGAGYYTSQ